MSEAPGEAPPPGTAVRRLPEPAPGTAVRRLPEPAPGDAAAPSASVDGTGPEGSPTGGTFRSLRHREFRLFFWGQLVSVVGVWVHQVAETWLVLQLTGSALAAGAVAAARFLPVLVLGLWGGVLADRHDKRRLLVLTQATRGAAAGVVGVLAVTGLVTPAIVVAAAVVAGTTNALDNPARRAFIKDLVPAADVMNAVSLNSSVMSLSRVVAPLVAAGLIATVGAGWCFLLNAASYVAVIASLLRMRADRPPPVARSRREGGVRTALAYVASTRPILVVLVLVGVVNAFAWNWETLLALHAERSFGGGATLYGVLFATFSLGTLVGALTSAARGRSEVGHVVVVSAALGAATVVVAVAPGVPATALALFATGVVGAVFTTSSNAALQLRAAPEVHGRVMAMYSVLFVGTKGIGALVAGAVAGAAGPRWGVGAGAVACLAAAAWAHATHRGRRPVRRSSG